MTVRFSLRRFRQIAWIAMFALMVNVLAPGISHALVAAGALPADTVEICTPTGVKLLSALAADPETEDSGSLAQSVAACAYCMAHAASFGLAPTHNEARSLQPESAPPAFSLFDTPTPARVWVVHSPRAPPTHA